MTMQSVFAVVRDGKIEMLESVVLPEGASLLVTILDQDPRDSWLRVSELASRDVWDNRDDDVYADLLKA